MFISTKIAILLLIQRGRSRARCVTSLLVVADAGSGILATCGVCNT